MISLCDRTVSKNKLTVHAHLLLLSFSIRRFHPSIRNGDRWIDGRDVHTKHKRGFVTPTIQSEQRWGLTQPRRGFSVVLIDFLGLDTGHARTHDGGRTEKKLIDKRSSGEERSGEKRLGQTRRPPAWGRFRRSDGSRMVRLTLLNMTLARVAT